MKPEVKIGIIGGSGLDNPDILEERKETTVKTPFGDPSDVLIEGKIKGIPCILLARHGRKHDIMPSNVNYRANIWALKEAKCTHILVSTACGSLQEHIKPGNIVFPDQFIDRTTKRASTFHDGSTQIATGVCHIPMDTPMCQKTREILIDIATEQKLEHHSKGTVITVEGPRFSTRAESHMFRSWGADVINMTTVPEVVLANELGLCYAAIAMATDYDCWRSTTDTVSAGAVMEVFLKNVKKVTQLILRAVPKIAEKDWTDILSDRKKVAMSSIL